MTALLEIKAKAAAIWGEYESYFLPLVKFCLAMCVFLTIRSALGFDTRVCKLPVLILLALICCLLPLRAMLWAAAFLILVNVFRLSLITAVLTFVVFVILSFVYFRFSPKDALAVLLTPIAFVMHIPFVMPIAAGLLSGPYSFAGVSVGTVLYYLLIGISSHAEEIRVLEAETGVTGGISEKINITLGQIAGNKDLYLVIAVFALTTIAVYLIRRINADHAWTLAIITGSLIQLVGLFVGYMVLQISGKTFWLLLGSILSMMIAFGLEFLFMNLDYGRVERVQFEDDEYYYYVKAVPKRKVVSEEKTIKYFSKTEETVEPEQKTEE